MDNMLFDLFAALVVLAVFTYNRFKQWPNGRSRSDGRLPRSMVSDERFFLFYGAYLCSYLSVTYVFHMVPEFAFLAARQLGSENSGGGEAADINNSFLIASLFVTTLLNNQSVREFDEKWRAALFDAARVPTDFLILKKDIVSFFDGAELSPQQINYVKENLACDDENTLWTSGLSEPIDDQVMMFLVLRFYLDAMEQCYSPSDDVDLEGLRQVLNSLEKDLSSGETPVIKRALKERIAMAKDELADAICTLSHKQDKTPVDRKKRFHDIGMQFLGHERPQIYLPPPVFSSIGLILVVSIFTIVLITNFLMSGVPFTKEANWVVSQFVATSLSFFIATAVMMMRNEKSRLNEENLIPIALALAVTVSFSFLYVQARGIDQLPPRMALALMCAMIVPIVVRALIVLPNSERDVHRLAMINGVYYALVCALLQPIISILFTNMAGSNRWNNLLLSAEFGEWAWGLALCLGVGAVRGFVLGYGITRLIQIELYREIMRSLRRRDRIDCVQPGQILNKGDPDGAWQLWFPEGKNEVVPCTVLDFHEGGARISCAVDIPDNALVAFEQIDTGPAGPQSPTYRIARVVWKKKRKWLQTFRAGLEFITPGGKATA